MSNNLLVINKLQELESRKIVIEKLLNDIKSHYFDYGTVNFTLNTNDYRRKSDVNECVKFDKELMGKYLASELKTIEIDILENITILSGGN